MIRRVMRVETRTRLTATSKAMRARVVIMEMMDDEPLVFGFRF